MKRAEARGKTCLKIKWEIKRNARSDAEELGGRSKKG